MDFACVKLKQSLLDLFSNEAMACRDSGDGSNTRIMHSGLRQAERERRGEKVVTFLPGQPGMPIGPCNINTKIILTITR